MSTGSQKKYSLQSSKSSFGTRYQAVAGSGSGAIEPQADCGVTVKGVIEAATTVERGAFAERETGFKYKRVVLMSRKAGSLD